VTKKNRRRQEEENRRRMDRHSHEKSVATKQANRQRLVLLGKELASGLHPVRMDSIADSLDEVDPKVRAVLVERQRVIAQTAGQVASALHPFVPPPSFVRPDFTHREKEPMPNASFVSAERVTPQVFKGWAGRSATAVVTIRLKLPQDIVRRVGDRLEGIMFDVELGDEGILYRPADAAPRPVSLPAWVPIKK
jgi:hypothetical protein